MGTVPQRRTTVRLFTEASETLVINDRGVEPQLEITFQAQLSITPDANSGVLTIFNLSPRSRKSIAGIIKKDIDLSTANIDVAADFTNLLQGDAIAKQTTIRRGDCYVEIDSGYDDRIARVFEGSSQRARHYRMGPTWATELRLGDGLATMMTGVASREFPSNTLLIDVIRHIVKTMALGPGNLDETSLWAAIGRGLTRFPDGFHAFGDAKWILNELLHPLGAEWFVDRGEFYVVKKGVALPDDPVVIDYAGGLFATPEPVEGDGIRIRSIFRPDIRIGRLVSVQGVDYSGTYRVDHLAHAVNNRVGDAVTDAILMPAVAQ